MIDSVETKRKIKINNEIFYFREANILDIEIIFDNINKKFLEKNFINDYNKLEKEYKHNYETKLLDKSYIIYLILDSKNYYLGEIRIENKNIVNIYLIKKIRGKGYAKTILKTVLNVYKQKYNINRFISYIIPENEISIKVFQSIGFKYIKKENYKGIKMLKFETLV
ncbi:acetyltransferase (GNAT) family protein [Hypnocyclicus thermotrophus]|uniref:Acetyltransferase (GNAT) family protein n=1 Tax=Hypnocyclicus thermotrophus TaxID=1627895 RepID=A0AA46I5G1_9FUSO|nr:GNAT family protein [Hypnocyclicus thermotrophus]TDT69780.1 acetyltransferase (GNAT) family protein [Hypnocyclicus thermotrophus]